MRFKKSGIISMIAISLILGVGCTTDNGDNTNGDNTTDQDETITWVEYENERFNYSIDYPEKWNIEESQNGDGLNFLVENSDQDIRVYGTHYIEDTSEPYKNAEDPNLSQEEVTLESGLDVSIISGDTEDGYHYEMVALENNIEYHFLSKTSEDFYNENQDIIEDMVNSFEISEAEIVELTEDRAIEIEEEFIDKIFSPKTVGKTNEIENYNSKEELISDVANIADRDLVEKHVDDYYREEEDKLYVVPKDGPAMILSDLPYSFNKIDDSSYELVQENENQLRGSYRLTVNFDHTEEGWKMTSRDIEIEEN